MVVVIEEDDLLHYGILRKSGRYPWGSGGTVQKRSLDFIDFINDLKRRLGMSDAEVVKIVGGFDPDKKFTTSDLRAAKAIAKNEVKAARTAQAQALRAKGTSDGAAAAKMGIPTSTYRALLAPGESEKANILNTTRDRLREEVDTKGYLDVGTGTEAHMGVSEERLKTALKMLEEEGYTRHYVKVPQPGTGKDTLMRVMAKPGVTGKEVWDNRDQIRSVVSFSEDGGRTFYGLAKPLALDPSRLGINYSKKNKKGEEVGGGLEDGVIYVRPGVKDVELGGSRYAQVRVQVGDGHYVKGMAIYKNDLPDGVDLVFNTNKKDTGDKLDALKELSDDPDNPFGSYIRRQILEKDADGNDRATSVMNLVNEEGNWGGGALNPKTGEPYTGWSKSIASQVLSKQSPELAKGQLQVTHEARKKEFDEIMALTNPTVRKKLLEEFADGTDSAAVHLKAASLPRQRWQVIIPSNGLKPTEIYAPNFRDGERVALVRYPHGGTFEIPELTVNNKHSGSRKLLGDSPDAVGINSKVAERLSGADFDGDTVLVIPNGRSRIRSSPALDGLKGFDPKTDYPPYDGMPTVDGGKYNASTKKVEYGPKGPSDRKQHEMGDVSNLITDMTIKGASHDKIVRAVRHSMVVIDSEKHALNYKLSYERNGIRALKEEYQGGARRGAATLISRAGSEQRVDDRSPRRASKGGPVDPVTGKKVYEYSGAKYINKDGKEVKLTRSSTRLAETDDAFTLSSGTPMERLYANHSNTLKTMANESRLAALSTPRSSYSPSAARTYSEVVGGLNAKLDLAVRNRPLERQALVRTDAIFRQKKAANPNMDKETQRKIRFQAMEESRRVTGAQRSRISFTDLEWEAIQAGAVSDSKLGDLLDNADMDRVRELATPRPPRLMTPTLTRRAKSMLASGFTRAQVADQLGVSITTLDVGVSGEEST